MKKWIGLLGLCAWTALAEGTLAPAFSDYMVLQRGAVAPVGGTAKPGEKVTVEFAGQTKRTVAGEDGRWHVRLDAINDTTVTGGLKVTGENILLIKGVLVGEVWFASGQSNMAMPVSRCRDFEKEQAAAKFPHIGMFITSRSAQLQPQTGCAGKWWICSPETVGNFSGAA